MSRYAIEVDGLSKCYNKGAETGLKSLKSHFIHRIFQKEQVVTTGQNGNQFMALDDVSFNITHGEAVGIIGRNGAGKSTLLKILSRITCPTAGEVRIDGRLGALLEVGTGFHPELTGRENIMLNASILGLSRRQIVDRFDAIVDFSEVNEFIDMPVKHYSSGMYMRLAFSVSVYLDPEILLLDEVMAVGDGAFQKKCLSRMDAVAKKGRTILLVSHSLPMIMSFCNRAILLNKGRIEKDGAAEDVVGYYQETLAERSNKSFDTLKAEMNKTDKARVSSIRLTPHDKSGAPTKVLRVGGDLEIEMEVVAIEKISDVNVAIIVSDLTGERLIDANLAIKDYYLTLNPGQRAIVRFTLKNLLLRPDTYRLGTWIGKKGIEDISIEVDAATFTVEVDPKAIQHFQVYPGVYQCEFTHTVEK